MTKFYNYFILWVVLSISANLFGQKGTFTFFDKTKSIYNSSFSGSEGGTILTMGHQRRIENWNTQYLLLSSKINNAIGVGASILREEIFAQKNTAIFANFSYNIVLEGERRVYFGIRAGGNLYNVDSSSFRSYNELGLNTTPDPLLQSYSNKFQPNIGVGIHYQTPNFFIGGSIPNLLVTNKAEFSNGQITKVANQFSMNVLGGYFWNIKENLMLKPYAQVAYKSKEDINLELGSSFSYYNIFELGVSYRLQESVSIFTLLNIPQTGFQLGYGYQMYVSALVRHTGGSHEIMLRYKF